MIILIGTIIIIASLIIIFISIKNDQEVIKILNDSIRSEEGLIKFYENAVVEAKKDSKVKMIRELNYKVRKIMKAQSKINKRRR